MGGERRGFANFGRALFRHYVFVLVTLKYINVTQAVRKPRPITLGYASTP